LWDIGRDGLRYITTEGLGMRRITSEELLDIIEQKGSEIQEALAMLREL
jgi:hypothetical protein